MDQILVGYDGSESSRRAAQRAGDLGRLLSVPVTVLAVTEFVPGAYSLAAPGMIDPVPPMLDTDTYERLVAEGVAVVRARGAAAEGRLEYGSPAERLVTIAEGEGFGMVVLGHRGSGGLETLLVGSVAKHVIDRAHCSVLVVR